MQSSTTPRYVLILGCSGRKRVDPAPLLALDRYDGVNYRVLRKARAEGHWPPSLDVLRRCFGNAPT